MPRVTAQSERPPQRSGGIPPCACSVTSGPRRRAAPRWWRSWSSSAPPVRPPRPALAGPVLVHRSWPMFAVLAVALVAAVRHRPRRSGCVMAGLTADWSADVRRRLCRVAFGQDLPTLETTPVGELLDRIDGDVYQVASELRGSGVRIAQSLAFGVLSIVDRAVRLVAGRRRHARARRRLLVAVLRKPTAAIGTGPHGRGGGLVRPGRGDGGVHPRPGRRAHQPGPALRAAPVRPPRQRGARPRPPGVDAAPARVTAIAAGRRSGPASRSIVVAGAWALATGRDRRRPADRGVAARPRLRRHRRARQPDGAGAAVRAGRLGPRAAAARRRRRSRPAAPRRPTATWSCAT